MSSPTIIGGMGYIGSEDGSAYAVELETGERRWKTETDDAVTTSPTVVIEPTNGDSLPSGSEIDLSKADEAIEAVRELQTAVDNTSSPPQEAVDLLEQAKSALENNQFESAQRHAEDGLSELESVAAEAASIRDDLDELKSRIDTVEADTDEAQRLSEEAESELEENNFDNASRRIDEANQAIDQAIAERESAQKTINELQAELRSADGELNTTTPEAHLSVAQQNFESDQYQTAEENATKGLEKLQQMRTFQADAREAIEKAEGLNRHAGVKKMASEFGYQEKLREARSSYTAGDYRDAYFEAMDARMRFWGAGFVIDGSTGAIGLLLMRYATDREFLEGLRGE